MSESHTNFELPGLQGRGLASLIAAISFAYSGQWNSRRLENHCHAFWNMVLLDLVANLAPNTIVIPQFQLDTIDDKPLAPEMSISTMARPDAKEITPDFLIAVFGLVRRNTMTPIPPASFPTIFDSWRQVKVQTMKTPLLAELKRPPSRSYHSRLYFTQDLNSHLMKAKVDLEKQVKHAFNMQPGLETVVAMACSGEWWSWMITTREAEIENKGGVGDEITTVFSWEEVQEVDPATGPSGSSELQLPVRKTYSRKAKETGKGKYRPSPSPPASESDKIEYKPGRKGRKGQVKANVAEPMKFIRHTNIRDMEQAKPKAEEAQRQNGEWTSNILFGTEASSQHLFLIHRFLKSEAIQQSDVEDRDADPVADDSESENGDGDSEDEDEDSEDGFDD